MLINVTDVIFHESAILAIKYTYLVNVSLFTIACCIVHCNLWGFCTDWYQLGSVQFGSGLFWTYSFPLQLVAIATKHSEKQHEQSALSWGKQPGIITIISMDEIKGILLFLILGLWLFEMCWSALSLNLRKTLKITIMTQSPCYNNNDRSKVFHCGDISL